MTMRFFSVRGNNYVFIQLSLIGLESKLVLSFFKISFDIFNAAMIFILFNYVVYK